MLDSGEIGIRVSARHGDGCGGQACTDVRQLLRIQVGVADFADGDGALEYRGRAPRQGSRVAPRVQPDAARPARLRRGVLGRVDAVVDVGRGIVRPVRGGDRDCRVVRRVVDVPYPHILDSVP